MWSPGGREGGRGREGERDGWREGGREGERERASSMPAAQRLGPCETVLDRHLWGNTLTTAWRRFDHFDAKWTKMTPVIEAKPTTLNEYMQSPSEKNIHIHEDSRGHQEQGSPDCEAI